MTWSGPAGRPETVPWPRSTSALKRLETASAPSTGAEETVAEAYAAYTEGMQHLDPELMPWESVEFGEQLGLLFLTPDTWREAAIAFGRAVEGIEALSKVIPVEQWGQELGQRLDGIVQLGAYCAGRAGFAEQAVSWLETHRTRALRNALRLDTSALIRLAAAGDKLARSYTDPAGPTRSDPTGAAPTITAGSSLTGGGAILRDQLGQLAQRIQAVPGFERFGATPDVRDAYRAATDGPLLYMAVTDLGGTRSSWTAPAGPSGWSTCRTSARTRSPRGPAATSPRLTPTG